jgi:hypothetical protein
LNRKGERQPLFSNSTASDKDTKFKGKESESDQKSIAGSDSAMVAALRRFKTESVQQAESNGNGNGNGSPNHGNDPAAAAAAAARKILLPADLPAFTALINEVCTAPHSMLSLQRQ